MRDFLSITQKRAGMVLACFLVLATGGLPAYGQQSPQNKTVSIMAGLKQENQLDMIRVNNDDVTHPFFKDMGVPGAAGVFHPRLAELATLPESHKAGNFTSHCGTGLTPFQFIDPYIINDRFTANPGTVSVFRFKTVASTIGESGLPHQIESNSSTLLGDAQHMNAPAGFSAVVANSGAFFNLANMTTRENKWWTAAERKASGPSKTCTSD